MAEKTEEQKPPEPTKEQDNLTPEQRAYLEHQLADFKKRVKYLEDKYKLELAAIIKEKKTPVEHHRWASIIVVPKKDFFKQNKIIRPQGVVGAKTIVPPKISLKG